MVRVKKSASARGIVAEAEDRRSAYLAPALEKGLDVLELLAGVPEGLTQSQIAQRFDRSLQEVYRMVVSLERRGYISRWPPGDAFRLTMKLYDLALTFPPIAKLTDAAPPIMRRLSLAVEQSVLLSVMDGISIRAIAHVDSPAPIGFRVRLGAARPVAGTASGRMLLAFQPPAAQKWTFEAMAESGVPAAELKRVKRRVDAVALSGYEFVSGETFEGITDVSFPILGPKGEALAALTMPFLKSVADKVTIERAAAVQYEAAVELSSHFGGVLQAPRFPLSDPLAGHPRSK
jgi:DNA-binding IclR family transcriptional regulator